MGNERLAFSRRLNASATTPPANRRLLIHPRSLIQSNAGTQDHRGVRRHVPFSTQHRFAVDPPGFAEAGRRFADGRRGRTERCDSVERRAATVVRAGQERGVDLPARRAAHPGHGGHEAARAERNRRRVPADRIERAGHRCLRISAADGALDAQNGGGPQRLSPRRLSQEPADVHRLRRQPAG